MIEWQFEPPAKDEPTLQSPGGKVLYLSPCCRGTMNRILFEGQESYICNCGLIGPWRDRIRISKRKMEDRT